MTLILLTHDWRHVRARFWVVLVPWMGLVVSTLYLRYHYAVDLIAAVVVWLIAVAINRRWSAAGQAEPVERVDQL